MGNETTVSAVCFIRGIEYIFTVCTRNENILTVEVEEKLTAYHWRAEFNSAYIEEMTHKTGNFKQFNMFVSMLESGIIQASESVLLDLITCADLEFFRHCKAGSAAKPTTAPQCSVSLKSKIYLMLIYTVEFDRIFYTLPLPYVGKLDPIVLQEQVRNLRAEIKAMKQQGTPESKAKELEKLQKEFEVVCKEKKDLETEFLQFRRELMNTTQGNAVKDVKMLKRRLRELEEELRQEKAKYQTHFSKHSQTCRELSEELDKAITSERNLKVRVKSLTNELAVYKRDNLHHSSRSSHPYSHERPSSRDKRPNSLDKRPNSLDSRPSSLDRRPSSLDRKPSSLDRKSNRERSLSRERGHPLIKERDHSRDRLSSADDRSTERQTLVNQSNHSDRAIHARNSLIHRNRTPSPAVGRNARFDPSGYVKSKENQKKEALLRRKQRHCSNISGSSLKSNKPSPTARLITSRLSDDAHAEMSDGAMSDSSYASQRNNSSRHSRLRSKTQQSNKSGLSPAYLSSPYNPKKLEKTRKSNKTLASTPDSKYGRTRSVRHKETLQATNGEIDNYFERSGELLAIDEQILKLQKMFGNNHCLM